MGIILSEVFFMKLEQSKTFINLAKDFAGECQARTRYKFIELSTKNTPIKTGYSRNLSK